MAYKPKTVATNDSVIDYLATLDESQQRELLERLQREGFACRALAS